MPKKANKTQKYGKKLKAKANFKFLDRFFLVFSVYFGLQPPPPPIKKRALVEMLCNICVFPLDWGGGGPTTKKIMPPGKT